MFSRNVALSLVLLPVNLNDMHWGLVVIDLVTKQAYFHDGPFREHGMRVKL